MAGSRQAVCARRHRGTEPVGWIFTDHGGVTWCGCPLLAAAAASWRWPVPRHASRPAAHEIQEPYVTRWSNASGPEYTKLRVFLHPARRTLRRCSIRPPSTAAPDQSPSKPGAAKNARRWYVVRRADASQHRPSAIRRAAPHLIGATVLRHIGTDETGATAFTMMPRGPSPWQNFWWGSPLGFGRGIEGIARQRCRLRRSR